MEKVECKLGTRVITGKGHIASPGEADTILISVMVSVRDNRIVEAWRDGLIMQVVYYRDK